MAVITASAAGGNFSAVGAWEGAKVPGKEDEAVLGAGSGNITLDVNSEVLNLDTSAYKKTFKLTAGQTLKILGKFTMGASATVNGTGKWELTSTAGTQKLTTAGITMPEITFNGVGGKWEWMDDWKVVSSGLIKLTAGTITTNSHNFEGPSFRESGGEVKYGTSKFILSGAGEVLRLTGAPKATEASFELTNTTENLKNIEPFSASVSTFTIATDNVALSAGITIAKLVVNTRGKSVKGTSFATGVVVIVTESLTTNATVAEKIKLIAKTAGKTWKLKKTSGTVSVEAVELEGSIAEGGATFVDVNGVNLTGNTGWSFNYTHTLTASQGQTVSVVKTPSLARALTQAQSVAKSETIARTLSVAQEQALAKATTMTRVLSITQAQAIVKSETMTRALSIAQSQTLAKTATMTRALSVTQAQSATRAAALARTTSTTQEQAIVSSRALTRALSVSQEQAVARVVALGRILSSPQGQSVARAVSIARSLSVAQETAEALSVTASTTLSVAQGAVPTLQLVVARTLIATQVASSSVQGDPKTILTITQGQSVARSASMTRAISATQGQSVARSVQMARTLAASQGQMVAHTTEVSRYLTVGQGQSISRTVALALMLRASGGQSASQTGVIHPGTKTLTLTQGQSVTASRTVALRRLVGQGQAVTQVRVVSRQLVVSQSSVMSLQRAVNRRISVAQGASASIGRTLQERLSATQPQQIVIGVATSRTLVVNQNSTPTLVREIVSHFIPGKMRSTVEAAPMLESTVGVR